MKSYVDMFTVDDVVDCLIKSSKDAKALLEKEGILDACMNTSLKLSKEAEENFRKAAEILAKNKIECAQFEGRCGI